MATKAKAPAGAIEIPEIRSEKVAFWVIGKRPLIMNRMSEKVKQGLLLPKGPMTAARKAASLKHNPTEELRSSVYRFRNPATPTLLGMPSEAFKAAMLTAVADVPDVTKAQIGRLVWVENDRVPVWGVPELLMSVVRNSDPKRTPDIRSRAILPRWAAQIGVSWIVPALNLTNMVKLLNAAGETVGVGDWRPEKGKGTYGKFEICNEDDPQLQEILKEGREAQEAALANPVAYDDESEDLFEWYDEEMDRRGLVRTA